MAARWRSIVVLLLAWSCTNCIAGESLAVIVAAGKARVAFSRVELAQIYRSKVVVDANGQSIVPVNLPVEHPVRQLFSKAVLGKSPQELQSYWNQQYFQGRKPPVVLESEEAVIRFVARTPGAIGYVFDCLVDERVRVIDRIAVDDRSVASAMLRECKHR